MKRRSSAGGKLAKPRGPKRSTPKHRNAPKATRNRGASIAGQEAVVARLTRERDEALLRETANSEILRRISKSPGDLELVLTRLASVMPSLEPCFASTVKTFTQRRN